MLPFDPIDVVAILLSAGTATPDPRVDDVLRAFAAGWREYAGRKFRALSDVLDDVIQDTLARLTSPENLAQLDNPSAVERWAKRIFTNRCFDYVRDRRALLGRYVDLSTDERSHDDVLRTRLPSQAPGPEELVMRERRMEILHRAMSSAPMARMKFLEGRSDEEIASALGKSTDAVSSWAKRFRKKLKVELADDDPE